MERTWRQITAKRSIGEEDFTRGVIDYDFSIGGKTVFNPSKSYFRIGVRLRGTDGAGAAGVYRQPNLANDVTFANFCPGNLFDNCFFYAGGQNVSSIVNYAPQAHAVGYRLKKSGAWMNSIGKDCYGINSDFGNRQIKSSTNDIAAASKLGHNPPIDDHKQNIVYFMYQPPIGIMEHTKPMGSGDYRFSFNPNSRYKKSCVESAAAALEPGATHEFDFDVKSMELYICTEKMDVSPTGTDLLHLMEHQVQSKKIGGAGDMNYDFTIPPSTKAISIFIQSGTAGSTTLVPPSSFKCVGADVAGGLNAQNSLKSIQLTYASTTKPPTRWDSTYDTATGVNKLQQRYMDTQVESSQAFSSGGCETFQQWKNNGVLLHYNWTRDASDRSTQLQIQADFATMEVNANLFVVAHYSKSVQMSITNGYISEVVSLTV